jgi:hypothetical protein
LPSFWWSGTYIEALAFDVEGVRIVVKTYADDSARMVGEFPTFVTFESRWDAVL